MSTVGQLELDRLLGRLEREWEEQVAGSLEVQEARAALQIHLSGNGQQSLAVMSSPPPEQFV